MEHPTKVHQVGEPFGVIVVHVREEDRIKLRRIDTQLRESHCRPAAYVKLQLQVAAIVARVSIPHQRARPCETVECGGTRSGAGQGYNQAGRGMSTRGGARNHNADDQEGLHSVPLPAGDRT